MSGELAHPVLRFIRKITASDSVSGTADAHLLSRFVVEQDQAAFAALVQRHGPMVWGVCRRVLHDAHEAEDAFQATFLVLARKARSLGKPESLGSWLYGVAYRTALHAKAEAARRRAPQGQVPALAADDPVEELIGREIRLVLDEEVNRLPSKYRAPFVLCYLEGQTHEEAARSLGCPRKTVTTRLTRARDRLRARLLRRGVTVSAGAFAAALSQNTGSAAGWPMPGVDSTAQAATQFAAGKAAAAGVVSARVAALTKGVLTFMFVTQLRTAALCLLAVAVVGAGVAAGAYRALAGGPGPARAEGAPSAAAEDAKKDKDGDKKTDKEKLQGAWVPVAVVTEGKKRSEQEIKDKNFEMVFSGDKVTVPVKGDKQEVTYKLDPSKKPKHIDWQMPGDKVAKGIYLLEGDTLKVCVSEDGEERPTEFESKEGSKIVLMELKKKK
jgi:RNA polymerase sigma-70 factor (ECF subfamily)